MVKAPNMATMATKASQPFLSVDVECVSGLVVCWLGCVMERLRSYRWPDIPMEKKFVKYS